MFSPTTRNRQLIRVVAALAVLVAALPLGAAFAGQAIDERPEVDVRMVDRWEIEDGGHVRATMMILVTARIEGQKEQQPLPHARITMQPLSEPHGRASTVETDEHGLVRIDANYDASLREKMGVQILDVMHRLVPQGAVFNQRFKYHGDPLPALYIFDGGNSRIQKFTTDGYFILSWGSQGFGNAQFCPGTHGHLAVDSDSNVYATDACMRIQKFTSYGAYLNQWGSGGNAPGQFPGGIHGIAIDAQDRVWTTSNNRIQRFDTNGVFHVLISTAGETTLPGDIVVDPDGDLWVYDWQNVLNIHEYSLAGDHLSSQMVGTFGDFTFDSDANFYGALTNAVTKISPDWSTTETWGPLGGGAGAGEFNSPESFAVDGDLIHILEQGNNRVQTLTTNGVYIRTFGAFGNGAGQFNAPTDIAVYH